MKNKKANIPILLGLLLIAAALILAINNILTENRAERISNEALESLHNNLPEIKNVSEYDITTQPEDVPSFLIDPNVPMPQINLDGIEYIAEITIPTLGLDLPVCSLYSDANLKKAPCKYYGSAYTDDLIICAHNYKKHFKYLKSLNEGDIIYLLDMNGNLFTYEMVGMDILNPKDVPEFYAGDWDLTLFTCTSSGSERIVSRFKKTA